MSVLRIIFLAIAISVAQGMPARASTIAYEGFEYAIGELNGQDGGTGFAVGGWVANEAITHVDDPGVALSYSGGGTVVDGGSQALRITGNANDLAFRQLASATAVDEIFMSFLFRYDGALDDNDFGVLWHDNVSTGSHTDRPNLGIKSNRGDGSGTEDVVARLQLSGSGQVYAVNLVAGDTYFILGRLHKTTPGAGNDYDRFDIWVNPTAGTAGAPDLTATGVGSISGFDTIGIRTANIDAGDTFWVDELRYATDFTTATVPEPSTGLLLASGLIALGRRRSSARSRHRVRPRRVARLAF
jgi:hypothetical protein